MNLEELLEVVFIEGYESGKKDYQDGIFIPPQKTFKNFLKRSGINSIKIDSSVTTRVKKEKLSFKYH